MKANMNEPLGLDPRERKYSKSVPIQKSILSECQNIGIIQP